MSGQWFKSKSPKFAGKRVNLWRNEASVTAENSWVMTESNGKVVDTGEPIEVCVMGTWKMAILRLHQFRHAGEANGQKASTLF